MAHRDIKADNLIFVLDIGTRSVIGVVGIPEGDILKVLHVETVEHTRRAVVDGQIEDIEQTARIAGHVKERLEQKLGRKLEQVHVAAAGRVLRTRRVTYEIATDSRRPIDQRQIFRLESEAIQNAYEAVMAEVQEEGEAALSFYCVGHSVIRYMLDGYPFSTIEGHRGKLVSVELVATFLPGEVVESLYATMQRIGLTVASLTLEPIAAISAVIPRELRLLNIALVDVGAGTSDIAVANEGSVAAYTMATVAGDEITERVMQELLVDFQVAEQVKFALSAGRTPIAYTDILGFDGEITAEALMERILPAVDHLAETVAERILEANGKPPMAIFMVGGGSRTPGLCPLVARHVGLDETKVAIGGSNYMKRLVEAEAIYVSAEYATPLGIALTAAAEMQRGSFVITLNGAPVSIQSSAGATVMEVLLRSGYQYEQIMGRSGRSVSYWQNGERVTVRGELPTVANISVNGRPASVTTTLQADDEIIFEPAVNGADADMRIASVIRDYRVLDILIDGEPKPAGTLVRVGGMPVGPEYVIRAMDKVEVIRLLTLGDILGFTDYGARHGQVYLNGETNLPLDTPLGQGDQIAFVTDAPPPAAHVRFPGLIADTGEAENHTPDQSVAAQPRDSADPAAPQVDSSGSIRIRLNGRLTVLEPKADGSDFFFFDALSYTDIDPSNPQGEIVILKNGRSASYIEAIREGDEIEIYWKQPTAMT